MLQFFEWFVDKQAENLITCNNKEEIRCSGNESGLLQSHTAQPYILTVLFVLLLVVLRVQYTQI